MLETSLYLAQESFSASCPNHAYSFILFRSDLWSREKSRQQLDIVIISAQSAPAAVIPLRNIPPFVGEKTPKRNAPAEIWQKSATTRNIYLYSWNVKPRKQFSLRFTVCALLLLQEMLLKKNDCKAVDGILYK